MFNQKLKTAIKNAVVEIKNEEFADEATVAARLADEHYFDHIENFSSEDKFRSEIQSELHAEISGWNNGQL